MNCNCSPSSNNDNNYHAIQTEGIIIFGDEKEKCRELINNTKMALKDLNISKSITIVTDSKTIENFKISSLPALMINGIIISSGEVMSKDDILRHLF